jgi:glycosyltransferase involved in cell wall biosynthesis
VTEGKTGFVAEPADSRSLAAAVAAALSDPGEAKRRADAARDMVLRRNTKERWLRDMTSLYEEMTRPRPTA